MGFSVSGVQIPGRAVEPGLYVVATPIGNLADITLRALHVLAGATLVACEDTRVSAKLLRHYGIDNRTISYHEHNANAAGPKIIAALERGESVALITDAGTPLVSDPGFRLVAEARARGIPVWPLPGASAPVAALSASGMPAETFLFGGFLPSREIARRKRLRELAGIPATLIFFESPNRLGRALADIAAELGAERAVTVARELTKLHEEFVSMPAGELAERYREAGVKGEIVLLVAPPDATAADADPDALLAELLERMSVSQAAAEAARLTGIGRRELYQRALALSQEGGREDAGDAGDGRT